MKIESFLAIKPNRFAYVTRFMVRKVFQDEGYASCDVEVVLAEQVVPGADQLRVRFFGATDVKVGDVNGTVVTLLQIYDISSRQLEDVRYRAVDEDASFFSLNCRDFDFELITSTETTNQSVQTQKKS